MIPSNGGIAFMNFDADVVVFDLTTKTCCVRRWNVLWILIAIFIDVVVVLCVAIECAAGEWSEEYEAYPSNSIINRWCYSSCS
jgi:hypothetical protein